MTSSLPVKPSAPTSIEGKLTNSPAHLLVRGASPPNSTVHCTNLSTVPPKHASNLSPYPAELIPFQPLDGVDNQYGQLYRKFKEHLYKEAGIKGFTPPMPFSITTQFLQTSNDLSLKWPTLAKLSNKLFPDLCQTDKDNIAVADDRIELVSGFYI